MRDRGGHRSGGRAATLALAGAALLSTGCFRAARELDVDGVHVELDADAAGTPFARDPAFPARLERMMRLGAIYWSGSDDLGPWRSWDVRLEATAMDCGSLEGHALGCTDHANHVLSVSTKDPSSYLYKWQVPCVEMTELIHEMGHALIGDGDHHDPRWHEFAALYQEVLFPEGGEGEGDDDGEGEDGGGASGGIVDRACQYHGWTALGGYQGQWDG